MDFPADVLSSPSRIAGPLTIGALLAFGLFWYFRGKQQQAKQAGAVPFFHPFDPAKLDRGKTESPPVSFGNSTVLPNRYAHEIRNDDRLSFQHGLEKDFLTTVPGLESLFAGTFHNHIVWDTASAYSRKLGPLIEPLSEESSAYLQKHWTDNPEWHEMPLSESMITLIASLTARIFIGEELCRNPEWLQIAISYTLNRTFAVKDLQKWHPLLVPIVHWFLPSCKKLRAGIRSARPFVEKALAARRQEIKEKGNTSIDAMSWIDGVAKADGRSYDATLTQLRLAYAAVHTTGDMMTKVMASICENEGLIQPLRGEIVSVLSQHGWGEAALAKMTLLDSVLKETQRIEPLGIYTLSRIAQEPVVLSDGTKVAKGAQVRISTDHMWNSTIWADAPNFDGYRFQKLRQESDQSGSLSFVSVSANHMGFGYGKHACPGRFFAGLETKIALCHLLLKYDFELVDKEAATAQTDGYMIWRDPRAMLRIRRRKEEIPL